MNRHSQNRNFQEILTIGLISRDQIFGRRYIDDALAVATIFQTSSCHHNGREGLGVSILAPLTY